MNKSFLKWAGGKSQLVEKILSLMPPDQSGRYIEPFVGSGVVALNVPQFEIIIGDTNQALIDCWKSLQNLRDKYIDDLETLFVPAENTSERYYYHRGAFNKNPALRALIFPYLNRHCFNGLCRFNSKGEFNVPYGKYKKVYFPLDELRVARDVTRKMSIYCAGFADLMNMSRAGDVIYCDPPYLPISETSNFTAYTADGFGMTAQITLAKMAEQVQKRGVTVIISNNAVPVHKVLYANATELHYVDVRKAISCKADGRKKLQEVLAVYRP